MKKGMRRFLTALLAGAMTLSLAAAAVPLRTVTEQNNKARAGRRNGCTFPNIRS